MAQLLLLHVWIKLNNAGMTSNDADDVQNDHSRTVLVQPSHAGQEFTATVDKTG
jgi:hypothetical protein